MESKLTTLFQELDRNPSMAAYTAAARQLEARAEELRPVRVALLASFTIEPLAPYLEVEAARRGFKAEVYVAPFNSVAQQLLDPASGCARHRPDVVFVARLLEDAAPQLAEAYLGLRPGEVEAVLDQVIADLVGPIERCRAFQAVFVVHNFAQRSFPLLGIHEAQANATQTEAIRRVNARLATHVAGQAGVHVLDFDRLCADVGYRRWRNEAAWYLGRAALGAEALRELAGVAVAFLQATLATPRKCLVLDLDNTLWGGVVGEVGMEGLELGSEYPGNVYRDFQKAVLELHRQGVLLAVNSKNNPRDAQEALRSHPDMVLRPEHFAAMRVNWRDKPQNMVELAEELNISVDSLVFFDDSPAEREMMRHMLPRVETLEVPADPAGYVTALLESRSFDKVSFTAEDRQRGEMYRAQRQRRDFARSAGSLEEYYRGLEMAAEIEPVSELSFQRAHSLLKKTNQFNLTTRRHAPAALRAFAESPTAAVFTLRLRDRFGDNGVVGLAIVELRESPHEEPAAVIDSFLLSCRVIGRTVETALLAHVADWARARRARHLLGVTRRTEKNEAFLSFYEKHGFREVDAEGDARHWLLELEKVPFARPPYIRLAGAASEVAA